MQTKFKVGDRVRVKVDFDGNDISKFCKKGQEFIIGEIDENNEYAREKPGITNGTEMKYLELAQQFKVGDWVVTNKFKTESIYWNNDDMSQYIGVKGQVQSINGDNGYIVHTWCWPASALTLVEDTVNVYKMPHDYYSKSVETLEKWMPGMVIGVDIIKPKKTIMQTLKDVSVKLRAALGDVKANQIVAGLRNDDLSLTRAGHDVIVNAIADGENAVEALATEATRIIAAAKAEKNS